MRKACLSVLVAGLLFAAMGTPASAGVEPSPFFTKSIADVRSHLAEFGPVAEPDVLPALILIESRLASFDPKLLPNPWITSELADQGGRIMLRLSANLFDPQPEPPGLPRASARQQVMIIDRISRILFDPQPEPPGYIALGFTALDRISWALFDPQPEPPGLSPDLHVPLVRVMYQLADVMERDCTTGLQQGTIPGLSALEALAGHLVVAVVEGRPRRAAAHVNAMSQIAEQYAAY